MASVTTLSKYAGGTHPGLQRENNEDRYYADGERGIYLVIDGVGGQAAGDVAADTALKFLIERLERHTGTADRRIREAITLANNEICRLSESSESLRGMACVLTAAVLEGDQLTIGHVGDTRLYEIHKGVIQQLTHDHSPVGAMEEDGTLTEEDAMRHPRRNEVYRDVGTEKHDPDDEDFIELIQTNFEPDSSLLLCSDGLSDMVPRTDILKIVEQNAENPKAVVSALIEAANEAGGKDNVTVVYVQGVKFALPKKGKKEDTTTIGALEKSRRTTTVVGEADVGASGRLKKIKAWSGSVIKVLASPWMTFIYGMALAIVLVMLAQKYFRLSPIPQNSPDIRSEQKRTLVVSQNGESDYTDIGTALMSARVGDTIQIAPGEYHEQLQVKEGVTLVSLLPREAVIRITKDGSEQAAVIARDIKTARIVGLKIIGDDLSQLATGIRLMSSSVIVEDVEITGTQAAAIEIVGAGTSTLRANFIHDNSGGGIVVRGENARPRLVHNFIVRNGKLKSQGMSGIQLVDGARPILLWNYVAENGGFGIAGLSNEVKEEVNRNNIFGQEK